MNTHCADYLSGQWSFFANCFYLAQPDKINELEIIGF